MEVPHLQPVGTATDADNVCFLTPVGGRVAADMTARVVVMVYGDRRTGVLTAVRVQGHFVVERV